MRLAAEAGAQREAVATLLPLIEADIAEQDAKRPPKVERRTSRKTKSAADV